MTSSILFFTLLGYGCCYEDVFVHVHSEIRVPYGFTSLRFWRTPLQFWHLATRALWPIHSESPKSAACLYTSGSGLKCNFDLFSSMRFVLFVCSKRDFKKYPKERRIMTAYVYIGYRFWLKIRSFLWLSRWGCSRWFLTRFPFLWFGLFCFLLYLLRCFWASAIRLQHVDVACRGGWICVGAPWIGSPCSSISSSL